MTHTPARTPGPDPLQPGFQVQAFHRDRIAEQIAAQAERRAAAQPAPTRKRAPRARKTGE